MRVGCVLRDDASTERPGHVLWLGVSDPAGAARPYYGAMLAGEDARQSWEIPLALNDSDGTWTITVTDVISGAKGKAALQVAPR